MALRLNTALEHRRRLRRAVRHLDAVLASAPEAWPTVGELAAAACLSPFHFLRLYVDAVGEPPQATVRRLKLQRARRCLAARPRPAVIEVALEHGYESAAAFARAYRRLHGVAPAQDGDADAPADALADGSVHAWTVPLPPLAARTLDVAGDPGAAFDELMGRLDVAGVPRHHKDMFALLDADGRLTHACAFDNPQVGQVLRLPRAQLGGSAHLCLAGAPQAVRSRLAQLAPARRGAGAPLLLRYVNDPAYHGRGDQRVELYVPLPAA